ncbi:probable E3 ubiquitin-protein ligase XERICO isoform X1 [Lactuca sativa]|uniref:probable E3 ubiquitin-protein ligase XERICO isoform X1 n=2 Tax=Lactuca sativa TaxID=4236 RepID=UPI001C68EA6C|nr:probable E3 ubiquitin-protein ligase XERICO isoform X1 [Lactuca sativa]
MQLSKSTDCVQLFNKFKTDKMGLSPYPTPSDAGVLCVILVNTAMSISIMKELVRSILHVIGIHVTSWEDYSNQSITESVERSRGTPSETYMEEFRSRTPSLLYDSLTINCRSKEECSVCLVEFDPDSEINRLSCGHVFHKSCVEKWLKYWNITCPLCRNHMMIPKEEENTCPM